VSSIDSLARIRGWKLFALNSVGRKIVNLLIRPEEKSDFVKVEALTREAFGLSKNWEFSYWF
jgi:hypothetical protein